MRTKRFKPEQISAILKEYDDKVPNEVHNKFLNKLEFSPYERMG